MIFRNKVCWFLWSSPYFLTLIVTDLVAGVLGYCVGYAVALGRQFCTAFRCGYDAANTESEYVPASNTVRGLP
jgi:hypothetical protein